MKRLCKRDGGCDSGCDSGERSNGRAYGSKANGFGGDEISDVHGGDWRATAVLATFCIHNAWTCWIFLNFTISIVQAKKIGLGGWGPKKILKISFEKLQIGEM